MSKQLTDGDIERLKTAVLEMIEFWKDARNDPVDQAGVEEQVASWTALLEKLENL